MPQLKWAQIDDFMISSFTARTEHWFLLIKKIEEKKLWSGTEGVCLRLIRINRRCFLSLFFKPIRSSAAWYHTANKHPNPGWWLRRCVTPIQQQQQQQRRVCVCVCEEETRLSEHHLVAVPSYSCTAMIHKRFFSSVCEKLKLRGWWWRWRRCHFQSGSDRDNEARSTWLDP